MAASAKVLIFRNAKPYLIHGNQGIWRTCWHQ